MALPPGTIAARAGRYGSPAMVFLCAVVPVTLALAAPPTAGYDGPPSRAAAFAAAVVATAKNPIVAATGSASCSPPWT